MVQLKLKSAGVSTTEIDLTGPGDVVAIGIPAGIVGVAAQGPAFVPITQPSLAAFTAVFGGKDNAGLVGPIAVAEWLRNAQAVTYMRVLGLGKGERRTSSGDNTGRVESAGFVVGQELPSSDGPLAPNPYANSNGAPGRMHLLGAYMSESAGSTIFSEAARQADDGLPTPIIRGIIMAPSGVLPRLAVSTSEAGPTAIQAASVSPGGITGSVTLLANAVAKQEFVIFLNGHKGEDASYPRVITASFDMTAPNYFGNVLNTDPSLMQKAGHYLYARYDVHPSYAVVTGASLFLPSVSPDVQNVAFLTTGSQLRNVGTTTAPSYENFEDRFATPSTTWIISQKFGGTPVNLFKVHALSDGAFSNQRLKISIESIAKSTVDTDRYGQFDLLVRDWNDSDENKIVLERWPGLSLNPRSDRYIARVIGDFHTYYDIDRNAGAQKLRQDGDYPNRSAYIRVAMSALVTDEEVDPTALPMGFRGPRHLVVSGTAPLSTPGADTTWHAVTGNTEATQFLYRSAEPPVPYRRNVSVGPSEKAIASTDLYWGVQFEQQVSLSEPNLSKKQLPMIATFTKYFPNFQTTWQDVLVGDNEGTAATAANGIVDADVYNKNLFSLENIRVVTGSDGRATTKSLKDWAYVRNANITTDTTAKTRAFLPSTDLDSLAVRAACKFTTFLQGGFDGVNIFNLDTRDMTDKAVLEEMDNVARGEQEGPTVAAYLKALTLMANTSEVDVKLLAVPGIRHEVVTDRLIDTVEGRFDAMAVLDVEERDALNAVVTSSVDQPQHVGNIVTNFSLRGLDSSFAAAYYPDVVMIDPFSGLETRVPPSVAALGALSLNDAIARPWNAPAGMTRGALETTVDVAVKLSRDNMDDLYEVDINPIVTFPDTDGAVIWGQKTLQRAASALDRINVRRLLIEIRREVRSISNSILFEPNRESTLARFSALVNPVLQRIQDQQGLDGFRVIIDATTTSQADIENNVIRGKIFLRPTRVAEFIDLDFVIQNAGVSS